MWDRVAKMKIFKFTYIIIFLIGKSPPVCSETSKMNECYDLFNSTATCKMPRGPEGMLFSLVDMDESILRAGTELDHIILGVSCSEGYSLVGSDITFCINGIWVVPIPRCQRTCYLWKEKDVTYHCYDVTLYTPCGNLVEAGSTIIAECKNSPIRDLITCGEDGYFDHVATCASDNEANGTCIIVNHNTTNYICKTDRCGDLVPSGAEVTAECIDDNYTYEGPTNRMICGEDGLFDHTVVCVPRDDDSEILRLNTVNLTPGSNETTNGIVRKKCIMPPLTKNEGAHFLVNGKDNWTTGKEHDSILILTTCDPGYVLKGNEQTYCLDGKWASNELPYCQKTCRLWKEKSISYTCNFTTLMECEDYIPAGTSIMAKCKDRFTAVNVTTSMTCGDNGYFDYVAKCLPINNITETCDLGEEDSVNFYCDSPNGLVSCPDSVPVGTIVTVKCKEKYMSVQMLDKMTCMDDGLFINVSRCVPDTMQTCQLELDESVDYFCDTLTGSAVCGEYLLPGSRVIPQCKDKYTYEGKLLEMTCKVGGNFDYIAKCIPEGYESDCGLSYKTRPLIAGVGKSGRVEPGEVPWHAGIYTKNTIPYMQICGGTIITTNFLISAAHCFWYEHEEQLAAHFAAAVGKIYRPWNNVKDVYAQKFNITKIHVPVKYFDSTGRFQDDIALLKLDAAIQFTKFVMPICLKLTEELKRIQLQDGNLGKVAGWGATNTALSSPYLNKVLLPYVDAGRCVNESTPSFKPYLTDDKFCAGYKDGGKSVCRGDSGGGLVFNNTVNGITRYYLQGVVSSAPPDDKNNCNDNIWTAFTEVFKKKDFLRLHFKFV